MGTGYPLGNHHRACALCAGIHWHDLGDEMSIAMIRNIMTAWLVVAAFYVGIMGTLALVHYAMEWMK